MSFFRINKKSNCKQIINQVFLRAKILNTNKSTYKLLSMKKSEKRISPFSSLSCRASMAVEAAIVLPVFLFFMMNILFAFDMLRLHANVMAAMHQTGNNMAFYGYARNGVTDTESEQSTDIPSVIMSEGYARGRVIGILGSDYLDNTCLASGTSGLHFMKSSVMKEDDIIDLIASYKVRPFIRVIGFPDFSMENRYYGRAWTGFDVERRQSNMSQEDPIVYITETGVVYHTARNCTYLCPSVEAASAVMMNELRNENGGKYYSCERCGDNKLQAVMYITSQGNRYHSDLRCSGLKRTIYSVHLSEIRGKGRCSKCLV